MFRFESGRGGLALSYPGQQPRIFVGVKCRDRKQQDPRKPDRVDQHIPLTCGQGETVHGQDWDLSAWLILAFSALDGSNTISRRGGVILAPVLGLRPTRTVFGRTTNEPKSESLTVSPRAAASLILSRSD